MSRLDAVGANVGEIWGHRQLAGIHRVEIADRPDADIMAAVQLALWVVDVRITPCHDNATLYGRLRNTRHIKITQRPDELRHRRKSTPQNLRAQRVRRI